jgi:hypothetical protein
MSGVGLVVMGCIGEFFGASKFVSDIICVFWPVLGDLCQCVVVVGGAVLRAFGALFGWLGYGQWGGYPVFVVL